MAGGDLSGFCPYHAVVLVKLISLLEHADWLGTGNLDAGRQPCSRILILSGQFGEQTKVQGVVESLHQYPELGVLETRIAVGDRWRGHSAGRFLL